MQCPNDQTTLAMMERQGIEIDYCPTCRGVWLDRGELDKLIGSGAPATAPQAQYKENDRREGNRYPSNNTHGEYPQHKRKESFLGDLFDF